MASRVKVEQPRSEYCDQHAPAEWVSAVAGFFVGVGEHRVWVNLCAECARSLRGGLSAQLGEELGVEEPSCGAGECKGARMAEQLNTELCELRESVRKLWAWRQS